MRKIIARTVLAASLLGVMPATAQAQLTAVPNQASAALGECLVGKSSGEDRMLVARWMGTSLVMSPAMKDIASVDAAKKDEIDRAMARLFTRLMTVECKAEMAVLVKNRDAMGIEAASGRLGEMAMRELLQDPAAMQALIAYARYVDPAAMQKLAE